MKHLTPGLLLTLTLAFAATANAQEPITGHDINEAIYMEMALQDFANDLILTPADTWECSDDGGTEECTLTSSANRSINRLFNQYKDGTYAKRSTVNQHPSAPVDEPLLTDDQIINLCTAGIRIAVFGGTLFIPPAAAVLAASRAGVLASYQAGHIAPKAIKIMKITYDKARQKFNIRVQFVLGALAIGIAEIKDVPETICGKAFGIDAG